MPKEKSRREPFEEESAETPEKDKLLEDLNEFLEGLDREDDVDVEEESDFYEEEQGITVGEEAEELEKESKYFAISISNARRLKTSQADRTKAEYFKEEQIETLRTACYNGTVLQNTASSVQPLRLGGVQIMCMTFKLSAGIRAIIPYNQMFETFIDGTDGDVRGMPENEAEGLLKKQRRALECTLGANISWIPTQIVPGDNDRIFVIGDRAAALRKERENAFLVDYPRYRENRTYWGEITLVSSRIAMIRLGGVERIVPQSMLTNRYADDLRHIFHPGDKLPVTLRRLSIDRDTGDVDCHLDALTGELIAAQENLRDVAVGEITECVISRAIRFKEKDTGADRLRMYGWSPAWSVPCKISTGNNTTLHGIPLAAGYRVVVKVTGIDSDGYLRCVIRTILGPDK